MKKTMANNGISLAALLVVLCAIVFVFDACAAAQFRNEDLHIDLSRYTKTTPAASASAPASASPSASAISSSSSSPSTSASSAPSSSSSSSPARSASSSPVTQSQQATSASVATSPADATPTASMPSPSSAAAVVAATTAAPMPSVAVEVSPSPSVAPSSWFSWISSSLALDASPAAAPATVASPAASAAADPADALPRWLRPADASTGGLRTVSVIVPAHNSSAYILRTLRSVEASIHHLLLTHNRGRELQAEVVIVDDASTDNTAMKVAGFIEERKLKGITNPTWKLVALQHNLRAGAARNFGVQASTGDVLFFCDSDDLYLEDHMFSCLARLEAEPKSVSVTFDVEIDAQNVSKEWAIGISQTLPMSTCMLRTFFNVIEGFPEGYYWDVHEDVAFLRLRRHAATLLGARSINDPKLTTKYMRYPGNALDRQILEFQKPLHEKKSDEEVRNSSPFMRQKELVLVSHDTYVRVKKIPALLAGRSVDAWDDFWAFYQSSIRKQAMEKNSTYDAELRLAPLKTWRASHLHNLAAVFERRGNRTYAQDMRNLVQTLLPVPAVGLEEAEAVEDVAAYHVVTSTFPSPSVSA